MGRDPVYWSRQGVKRDEDRWGLRKAGRGLGATYIRFFNDISRFHDEGIILYTRNTRHYLPHNSHDESNANTLRKVSPKMHVSLDSFRQKKILAVPQCNHVVACTCNQAVQTPEHHTRTLKCTAWKKKKKKETVLSAVDRIVVFHGHIG
jgi:hypothetical protein